MSNCVCTFRKNKWAVDTNQEKERGSQSIRHLDNMNKNKMVSFDVLLSQRHTAQFNTDLSNLIGVAMWKHQSNCLNRY